MKTFDFCERKTTLQKFIPHPEWGFQLDALFFTFVKKSLLPLENKKVLLRTFFLYDENFTRYFDVSR